jgi:hypothetical protein
MYVVKLYRDGKWVSWGSAAHPRVINGYLELAKLAFPGVPVMVDKA